MEFFKFLEFARPFLPSQFSAIVSSVGSLTPFPLASPPGALVSHRPLDGVKFFGFLHFSAFCFISILLVDSFEYTLSLSSLTLSSVLLKFDAELLH